MQGNVMQRIFAAMRHCYHSSAHSTSKHNEQTMEDRPSGTTGRRKKKERDGEAFRQTVELNEIEVYSTTSMAKFKVSRKEEGKEMNADERVFQCQTEQREEG